MHLGQRAHLWNGTSYFDLPTGTVSKASAQALVDYLNRQGWRASLARTQGSDAAQVTILGTVEDLSIDATSGFMHTDLSAKNTLALQIINHSDNSIVRERVSGSGTDQVFWFEPEDAQALTTELLESNFQKFVNDVRVDGRTIRLK
jgi:3-keto-L-gulonate-6-phosphate decarboxylase